MTLLIVNDDASIRRRYGKLFKFTKLAGTIEDGLRKAQRYLPSVILLGVRFRYSNRTGISAIPEFRRVCERAQIVTCEQAFLVEEATSSLAAGSFAHVEDGDRLLVKAALIVARRSVSSSFVDPRAPLQ